MDKIYLIDNKYGRIQNPSKANPRHVDVKGPGHGPSQCGRSENHEGKNHPRPPNPTLREEKRRPRQVQGDVDQEKWRWPRYA